MKKVKEKEDKILCAISGCKNQAEAIVEHDGNYFAIPLCQKHLKPYVSGFETEAFVVKFLKDFK